MVEGEAHEGQAARHQEAIVIQEAAARIQRMDTTNRAIEWPVGQWKDIEDFEWWWRANSIAFNRLAVTHPDEWEHIAKAIEKFQKENPR